MIGPAVREINGASEAELPVGLTVAGTDEFTVAAVIGVRLSLLLPRPSSAPRSRAWLVGRRWLAGATQLPWRKPAGVGMARQRTGGAGPAGGGALRRKASTAVRGTRLHAACSVLLTVPARISDQPGMRQYH
jgi:hypothetical protein